MRHNWSDHVQFKQGIARRDDMPPLISFGCEHSLPRCHLSNAFETATRTYRHLSNGTESENGTARRTDGLQHRFMLPDVGRGHNKRSTD